MLIDTISEDYNSLIFKLHLTFVLLLKYSGTCL